MRRRHQHGCGGPHHIIEKVLGVLGPLPPHLVGLKVKALQASGAEPVSDAESVLEVLRAEPVDAVVVLGDPSSLLASWSRAALYASS
jgi:hypothetical protein